MAVVVAAAFLEGPWGDATALATRAARAVDVEPARLLPLVDVTLAAYRDPPADRLRELARFVKAAPEFDRLWQSTSELEPAPYVQRHPLPRATSALRRWPVPQIADSGDLASWLGLDVSQLDWYADVRSIERRTDTEALRHYRYIWRHTRRGRVRMLEAPKPRLRAIQRRLLHEILTLLPAHEAAHGFVPGRSPLTFAAPHVDHDVVVHLDLEGFFASVPAGRVFAMWRLAGYAETVAHTLTGLTTNVVPLSVRRSAPPALRDEDVEPRRRLLDNLAHPHLAQGAPTSPALANLAAWRLDRRLAGLAHKAGAIYTRYADDLAFSLSGTGAPRRARRLADAVTKVVSDEGFRTNASKTRIASRGQQQLLAGVVVNARPSVPRADYDRLRAILHNCLRDGPAAHNRVGTDDFHSHLLGRISWVRALDPVRGDRLRADFDRIAWP